MVGRSGVWEMTWSFAGPDGRSTFDFVVQDEDLLCQWRRIGDHGVYQDP